jgi:hypothetical protein
MACILPAECKRSCKDEVLINNYQIPTVVKMRFNHLDGGSMIKVWDQETCFFCNFRFKPCGCSYDGH